MPWKNAVVCLLCFLIAPGLLAQNVIQAGSKPSKMVVNQSLPTPIEPAGEEGYTGIEGLVVRDGKVECQHLDITDLDPNLLKRPAVPLHTLNPPVAGRQQGMKIILRGTLQLENYPKAKAAYQRAAAKWESLIANPITLVIDVDYGLSAFGQPFPQGFWVFSNPQIYSVTDSQISPRLQKLKQSAASELDREVYAHLPSQNVPTVDGNVAKLAGASPQLRAIGAIDPVADPGKENFIPRIQGVSSIPGRPELDYEALDWDPSDGIDPGTYDMEGAFYHEIGHILGFTSNAGDKQENPDLPVAATFYDLFRVRPGTQLNDFDASPRITIQAEPAVFFLGRKELPIYWGITNGFRGHWKASFHRDLGVQIGTMGGSVRGSRELITDNDLAALDLMGFKIAVPYAIDQSPPEVSVNLDTSQRVFSVGETIKLNWQASDNIAYGNFTIELSTDGGMTFPTALASGIPSTTTSFEWKIQLRNGAQAQFRVTTVDGTLNEGSGVSPMFEIRQPALESPSQLTASKTEQRVSLRWMPVSTETESTELIKPAGFGEGAIFPQLDLAATSRDGAKAVLFGEVLTPKSYPATLKKVYYLSAGSLFDRGDGVFRKSAVGARFQMRIFNLPPNGDLDQLWLNPREYEITIHKEPSDRLSVREPDDFNHYDISEYTIDQGNFYVSFQFVDKGTSQISERGDDFPFVIKSRGPVSGFGSTHGDGGYLVTTDQFVANKPSDFPILGEVAYGTPKPAITGYRIYRSTTTPVTIKPENLLAEVNAGTSSFQDELPPESIGSYFYAVTARSGDRESNASNEAKITLSDFQLSITPTTQTLAAGQMTTAQLTVEAINGFSQPVMLSGTVEPAGSGLTVQPSSTLATPGTTIPILLGAGSASQPGSYTVTLTGTVGTLARSITLNLTVVVPDFSIGFVPESLTISRGGKGQFQLQITRMGGLTGPIKMTFPDTKALKLKLSPSNPTISGTTFDITFKSKKSSPAGTYPLVFTGTDETGRTRTTILSVAIQ